jgi:hypothetical protein
MQEEDWKLLHDLQKLTRIGSLAGTIRYAVNEELQRRRARGDSHTNE